MKAVLKNWVQSPAWFWSFVIASVLSLLTYALNAAIAEIHPGNVWGLTYGTLASLLLAGAALYGLRRRMVKFAARNKLGTSRNWVQFHLYGGTLFLLLTFMHTGFHLPHGPLNWWMWILAIWVTLSGILGVLLQKWIPKILASGLSLEVVYERIPELITEIKNKAEELVNNATEPVKEFYQKNLAPAFLAPSPRWIYYFDITGGIQAQIKKFEFVKKLLPGEEKMKLEQLESMYRTKLELDAHYTLQKVLRLWLYTHVPLSLVLLLLVILHLYAVLVY